MSMILDAFLLTMFHNCDLIKCFPFFPSSLLSHQPLEIPRSRSRSRSRRRSRIRSRSRSRGRSRSMSIYEKPVGRLCPLWCLGSDMSSEDFWKKRYYFNFSKKQDWSSFSVSHCSTNMLTRGKKGLHWIMCPSMKWFFNQFVSTNVLFHVTHTDLFFLWEF